MGKNPTKIYSTKYIAEVFGITQRSVQQLAKDGKLHPVETNPLKFDLIPTVKDYIEHLKSMNKPSGDKDVDAEKQIAERDWKRARADKAQMELDELRANMHRSEDVEEAFNDFATEIKDTFLALPGRLAMDCAKATTAAEVSDIVKKVVFESLNTLSKYQYDPDFYKGKVRERQNWEGVTDDEELETSE